MDELKDLMWEKTVMITRLEEDIQALRNINFVLTKSTDYYESKIINLENLIDSQNFTILNQNINIENLINESDERNLMLREDIQTKEFIMAEELLKKTPKIIIYDDFDSQLILSSPCSMKSDEKNNLDQGETQLQLNEIKEKEKYDLILLRSENINLKKLIFSQTKEILKLKEIVDNLTEFQLILEDNKWTTQEKVRKTTKRSKQGI